MSDLVKACLFSKEVIVKGVTHSKHLLNRYHICYDKSGCTLTHLYLFCYFRKYLHPCTTSLRSKVKVHYFCQPIKNAISPTCNTCTHLFKINIIHSFRDMTCLLWINWWGGLLAWVENLKLSTQLLDDYRYMGVCYNGITILITWSSNTFIHFDLRKAMELPVYNWIGDKLFSVDSGWLFHEETNWFSEVLSQGKNT